MILQVKETAPGAQAATYVALFTTQEVAQLMLDLVLAQHELPDGREPLGDFSLYSHPHGDDCRCIALEFTAGAFAGGAH